MKFPKYRSREPGWAGSSQTDKTHPRPGIPFDAASLFRRLGYECLHVSELGMHKAEDEKILALAQQRESVVITLDADFHALVALRRLNGPSVVRLRREGCRAEAVVGILEPGGCTIR